MQKKELVEQIGKLNVKITTSNKESEKLELEYKKKRLELKKYKNERVGLQLKLQELELESNKKVTNNMSYKISDIKYIAPLILRENIWGVLFHQSSTLWNKRQSL